MIIRKSIRLLLVSLTIVFGLFAASCSSDDKAQNAVATSDDAAEKADTGNEEDDTVVLTQASEWAVRGAAAAGPAAVIPAFSAGVLHVVEAAESDQRCGFSLVDALAVVGVTPSEFDGAGVPETMAEGMDVLLGEGHDVIFGISVEPGAIAVQLQRAADEGVTFINMCGTVRKNDLVAASPVPSDYAQAALAGQYIIDMLYEDNKSAPEGQIAVIEFPQILSLFQRVAAVEWMLEEWDGIEIVARHEVDFANPNEDIRSAVLDIVTANPDIDVIYTLGDFMIPATVSALDELGVTNNEVKIVSAQSGSPSVLSLIAAGKVAAVVDPRLDASGWISVDVWLDYLARGTEMGDISWHQYEHFYEYKLLTADNINPNYEMRPGYVIETPVTGFVEFFTAKWTAEYGLG
jgi:ABC-type sugar transport system substrate-binding protein